MVTYGLNFMAAVAAVALSAAFLLALLNKWNVLEWMQVHAPSDTLYKLLTCHFCLSFWMGVILSAVLAVSAGDVSPLFIPVFSTVITVRLW